MREEEAVFEHWIDSFFAAYYDRRPVNATFIGAPGRDGRLPDYSEAGQADTLSEMKGLLRSAATTTSTAPHARMDRTLATGFLETQIWEAESEFFQRGNPSFYTGEAAFAVMSLFLNASGSLADRFESARARAAGIPDLLAAARASVRTAPVAWTERAIQECEGGLAFFRDGIDRLSTDALPQPLRRAADAAARAFAEHKVHLETDLLAKPHARVGCGAEALDLILRRTHFVEETADELADYALDELSKAEAAFEAGAVGLGATNGEEALRGLAAVHPTREAYLGRYQELWDDVHRTCVEQDLVSWPSFPIRYVARPRWARAAAPHLYFLFYRSPRAFNRPPVHEYLVTPIEADLTAEEQRTLLEANNESVIKLNHVIHHGSVGHHVQNWHAFRSNSRVGQIAAVDCASRTAMGCGGTMAEGWACYATDLMSEAGLLTPLERLAEHRSRMRMCARAFVDVRLHQQRFDLDAATDFYVQRAGMPAAAARRESVKNSMFPGGALMYLVGRDGIHRLRAQMARRWGNAFSLRRFHDEFLSYGSVPVPLIAREMA